MCVLTLLGPLLTCGARGSECFSVVFCSSKVLKLSGCLSTAFLLIETVEECYKALIRLPSVPMNSIIDYCDSVSMRHFILVVFQTNIAQNWEAFLNFSPILHLLVREKKSHQIDLDENFDFTLLHF